MDVAGRYVAILLAVILMILFPLQYHAQSQSETMDKAISAYATEFTETARHQGFITLNQYEEFVHKLDSTGELYDVTLEAAHPVTGNELPEITLGDEMPELVLKSTSYPRALNSDIHIHTKGCYTGHRHDDNCLRSGDLEQKVYVIYRKSNIPIYATVIHTFQIYCSTCDTLIARIEGRLSSRSSPAGIGTTPRWYLEYYTHKQDETILKNTIYASVMYDRPAEEFVSLNNQCSANMTSLLSYFNSLPIANTQTLSNGYIKTTRDVQWEYFDLPYIIGKTTFQTLTVPYLGCLTCTCQGDYYSCRQMQDETSDCNTVVTSITATNPIQEINKGSNIATTAMATYLDGHTGIANCTSNFNPNLLGTQTVTLTYTGLVGDAKTTGTRTCTIAVTVIEPFKLTDINITPANQVIERYNNPSFTIIANYDDGTSKYVTDYTILDYNSSTLGTQSITIAYTEGNITKTAKATVLVTNLSKLCPVCSTIYELDELDRDNGCPKCNSEPTSIIVTPENVTVSKGEELPITVEALYVSGSRSIVTGWTSNYEPLQSGYQEVSITYEGMQADITVFVIYNTKVCPICGEEYLLNEDGSDPGCPSCSTEVTSITATPEEVTIEVYQPLPITVIATFRDGHTEPITNWSTDIVADTPGSYDVTVYYKSAQTHVAVTILDRDRIQCPHCGLVYSFKESPGGCPVCSVTIVGIEAALRNGGITVRYNSDLDLEIVLIFQDSHQEVVYTGWNVEGYQPDELGMQTVTVFYQGHNTALTFDVVNDLPKVICPNGHEYYLNEDGSNSGCPYCVNEINEDNAVFFFDITYTSNMIKALYADGIYYLKEGDYLTVTVTPRNTSLRSKMRQMFFGTSRGIKGRSYTFGGEVL